MTPRYSARARRGQNIGGNLLSVRIFNSLGSDAEFGVGSSPCPNLDPHIQV